MSKPQSPSLVLTIAVSAAVSSLISTVLLLHEERRFLQLARSLNTAATPASLNANVQEGDVSDVVLRAQPSVAAVMVSASTTQLSRRLLEQLPDPSPSEVMSGFRRVTAGSGFFVTADGLLVTNRHVVDLSDLPMDARKYEVTLHDGRILPARIMALDPVLDIAFLQVQASTTFSVMTFADSDKLRPGQTVIAIGNALSEFPNTVTKGVISGVNRRVWAGDERGEEVLEEAIQTDAAINPGNSGGPLLNVYGQVVGMNTAVAEDGQSLGFALPSNVLLRSLESVKTHGRVVRPYLGIRYVIRDQGGAEIVGGDGDLEEAIIPGSPADQAGLRERDVILSIDGIPVTEERSPVSLIGKKQVGETIHLVVERGGEQLQFDITLIEFKP